ncbi:caspase family protein [Archangium lipolyticum]|uniref:caspase family protein n=1 Tax=Archangium lipolyticum TaxID=2970465 RepID=UPI00214A5C57|nr:caspase family protein [Archangium lipolyticum]
MPISWRWLLSVALFASGPAYAVQRFALVIGANTGWAREQPLRHAVEDARKLAETLEQLGEFSREDITVLSEPTTDKVLWAFDQLAARAAGSREESLFLFYYSGHADDTYLHLRGPPLRLDALHRRIQALSPALKIGILDACQSGSILPKGGRPTRSFQLQVRDELALRGLVFLTSSGADELSQEARALAGSIFSTHLVSGLRGAADADRDGQVSLTEAYRHAYEHTLMDTASSPLGVQRPRVRIDLKGQGELVLTRLSRAGAIVVFPPGTRECVVTDGAEQRLLAEVPASSQRERRLGVGAGDYVLKCNAGGWYEVAPFKLAPGDVLRVSSLSFREVPFSQMVVTKGTGDDAQRGSLKRQGFRTLAEGRAEEALQLFEQALGEDRRDQEAFLGKARALLAMAEREEARGRSQVAKRLRAAAVMAYPRIEEELMAAAGGE